MEIRSRKLHRELYRSLAVSETTISFRGSRAPAEARVCRLDSTNTFSSYDISFPPFFFILSATFSLPCFFIVESSLSLSLSFRSYIAYLSFSTSCERSLLLPVCAPLLSSARFKFYLISVIGNESRARARRRVGAARNA